MEQTTVLVNNKVSGANRVIPMKRICLKYDSKDLKLISNSIILQNIYLIHPMTLLHSHSSSSSSTAAASTTAPIALTALPYL
eukprot:10180940-Ditylum_brightwellii.AAC.1